MWFSWTTYNKNPKFIFQKKKKNKIKNPNFTLFTPNLWILCWIDQAVGHLHDQVDMWILCEYWLSCCVNLFVFCDRDREKRGWDGYRKPEIYIDMVVFYCGFAWTSPKKKKKKWAPGPCTVAMNSRSSREMYIYYNSNLHQPQLA